MAEVDLTTTAGWTGVSRASVPCHGVVTKTTASAMGEATLEAVCMAIWLRCHGDMPDHSHIFGARRGEALENASFAQYWIPLAGSSYHSTGGVSEASTDLPVQSPVNCRLDGNLEGRSVCAQDRRPTMHAGSCTAAVRAFLKA